MNAAVRIIRTSHVWPITHTRIKDNLQLLKFGHYKSEIKNMTTPNSL